MAVETKMKELVTMLKEWIIAEPEVPETSDELLKLFAHLSKGDYDSAKGRILFYYNIRASTPGLFFDRDIDNDQMKIILEQYHFFISPKLTSDGYKVLLHHGIKRDVKRYDMWAHMKYFLLTLDASLVDEDNCVGYYIIFDFTFYTIGHVLKISPTGILNTCTYLQDAIPLHIQEVFLINASSVVDIMMKSIRPFMSCSFINKLTIIRTGDLDKLYEKVPRECLPSEYGGLLSSSPSMNEVNTIKLRSLQGRFASEEAVLKTLKANH